MVEWVPGLLASGLAAGGTVIGALPALWMRTLPGRAEVALLSGAAGLMLAAATLGLLPAAADLLRDRGIAGVLIDLPLAFPLGAALIGLVNRMLPHEHFIKGPEGTGLGHGATSHRWSAPRIWLLVVAIAIHNIPEGLAVGAGFGTADNPAAWPVAVGISLQNVPEGLVVAVGLRMLGYASGTAALTGAATGLLEFVGGAVGLAAGAVFNALLPWMLAGAAGAMVYVVGGEVIPESHRHGQEETATVGLIAGFTLYVLLDVLFP